MIFCFDFNVNPGVAVICQEQVFTSGVEGTGVIGEVWIENNSNTYRVTAELCDQWKNHLGPVYCYGDASGGSRHTSQTEGSDWELIKKGLYRRFPGRYHIRIPGANPSVRARINAVNSRCKAMDGTVRLMVDPAKAPHVVKDLEGTPVTPEGLIDKEKDSSLSHLSDSIGYYLAERWPVRNRKAGTSDLGW